MNVLYPLQHLGFVIPPRADAGWIGSGPRPQLPRRGIRWTCQRLHQPQHHLHDLEPVALVRMIRDSVGVPTHGNQRAGWEAGFRYDFPG